MIIKEEVILGFHGSPYEFNNFDMSKIGSGDGLNKYGYGLYFADREDTAEYYAQDLTLGKHKETGLNIYEVKLNGEFYQWDYEIPQHIHQCVIDKLRGIGKEDDADEMEREAEEYGDLWSMDSLYQWLMYVIGSPENTSKFLVTCGVDGVIAQSPAHEGNVIVAYDDNAINITNRKKLGEDLDEIIRREIWTMNENVQQMDKVYTNTGLFTDEDKKRVLSITNGDNYTKTMADIYAWLHQIKPYDRGLERKEPKDEFDKYEGIRTTMKEIHDQLKGYNKYVFPIADFNPSDTSNHHPIEVWSAIKRRKIIIDFFRQIPSLFLRNIKEDIRKPIDIRHYEYYLNDELNNLKEFFNKIDQLSDEKKTKILKKVFSSKNKSIKDIVDFTSKLDVLFLSHSDEDNEVVSKVNE